MIQYQGNSMTELKLKDVHLLEMYFEGRTFFFLVAVGHKAQGHAA